MTRQPCPCNSRCISSFGFRNPDRVAAIHRYRYPARQRWAGGQNRFAVLSTHNFSMKKTWAGGRNRFAVFPRHSSDSFTLVGGYERSANFA